MQRLETPSGTALYRFVFPANASNMYVFLSDGEALVVDVFQSDDLERLLDRYRVRRLSLILTHGHWDHISGVEWARCRYDCTVYAGENERELLADPRKNLSQHFEVLLRLHRTTGTMPATPDFRIEPFSVKPDGLLVDGETFLWQGRRFEIHHTPGHTEGSICILTDDGCLFSGDSLVNGYLTITRWPTGSRCRFEEVTLPFFESLPEELTILPGHGEPDRLGSLKRFLYEND